MRAFSTVRPFRFSAISALVDGVRLPAFVAHGFAVLFALLALYGLWSFGGIVTQWGSPLPGILPLILWVSAAGVAVPLLRGRPGYAALAALAVLAAALRLWPLLIVQGATPVGDAFIYPEIARSLLAGHGLGIDEPGIGMRMWAFYPPGFPLLLAEWGAVAGLSPLSFCAFNLLTDGAAALLLARLGTRLGHAGAGRAAAWLYLIWPSVLLSAPYAQKEGLCVLLILALVHAWMNAVGGRNLMRDGALIGALAALLGLTQPGFMPIAGLIGLLFVGRLGPVRTLKLGTMATVLFVAVMLPWWVRNMLVFHTFVPLTTASGVSLWVGNNPDATGNWLPTPANVWGADEIGYGKITGAIARDWIAAHPVDFVRLTLTKFIRALGVSHFGAVRLSALNPPPDAITLSRIVLVEAVAHLMLLGGMALALWRRAGRLPPLVIGLIVIAFAQMALFGVWFEFGERHRVFLLPLILLAAMFALAPRARDAVSDWFAAAPRPPAGA